MIMGSRDLSTKPRGLYVKPSGEVVVRYPGGARVPTPPGSYQYEPPEEGLPQAADDDEYDRLFGKKST
jgi:hypothetical protein